jgi:putative peptide zinc metalloprotease protein
VTDAACPVGASSRITLHPLRGRQDGTEWIVGRMDTGEFVALPDSGRRAIGLLTPELTVGEVRQRLAVTTGHDLDVVGFVRALVELGFVARVDGVELPGPRPPRPTWPWLRAGHLRWLLHPAVAALPAVLVLAAAAAVLHRPGLLPGYHDLLFSSHGSLVLGAEFTGGWTLVFLHELCHLLTARAAGVPGRIRLGTRLQFLVAHTDVSGVVTAPRRHRLTVYLAGIACNVSVCAACVLVLAVLPERTGTPGRLVAATAVLSLLSLPFECMVFMRTDLYFVLEDLAGARDLYGDGTRYARYLAGRAAARLRGRPAGADPSAGFAAGERRAVRAFSVLLVAGTAGCLTLLATVTLPVDVGLLSAAVRHLTGGPHGWDRVDAAAVLLVLGGIHALWAALWWRRHRHRVTALARRLARRGGPRPA